MRTLTTILSLLPFSLLLGCQAEIGGSVIPEFDTGKSDESAEVRIGNFPGPDGTIRAPYIVVGDYAVVGGDMIWKKEQALNLRSAGAGPFTRWPGAWCPTPTTRALPRRPS